MDQAANEDASLEMCSNSSTLPECGWVSGRRIIVSSRGFLSMSLIHACCPIRQYLNANLFTMNRL